jgi:iron complex transport system permease protein
MSKSQLWKLILLSTVLLLVTAITGLSIGPVNISFVKILQTLLGSNHALSPFDKTVLIDIRMPRIFLAILVGAALAISGGTYQTVFHNPLADPYLLGSASGAGLGATIAITSGGNSFTYLPFFAFIGSMAAVGLTLLFSGRFFFDPATLVLSGIAIGAFATSIQTYLQQRHSAVLRPVYSWILGDLTNASWGVVRMVFIYILLAMGVLITISSKLDALLLSDDEAHALGINVKAIRLIAILAASFATATAVAASGLIGFVGLVVPHIVKNSIHSVSNKLLIVFAIIGGAFLTMADLVARVVLSPAELPIGVVTAFIGAPFFLYILRRKRIAI